MVLAGLPTGGGQRFKHELLYSPQQIALFHEKSARDGEFERALKPPDALEAKVSCEAIVVTWALPADFAALGESLRSQPLLRLGFRVYRWREGEEWKQLSALDGQRTEFEDRDLPLWRERFSYCVATVLEGTIGDLPTLIESKRSSVIPVETQESFTLAVLDGAPDHVRVELSTSARGAPFQATFDVAAGAPIVPPVTAELPADAARRLDTGLIVDSISWVDGTREEVRQRPEFLPDGRRKLDPASGAPLFRAESAKTPTRKLEVICRDRSGASRKLESPEQSKD